MHLHKDAIQQVGNRNIQGFNCEVLNDVMSGSLVASCKCFRKIYCTPYPWYNLHHIPGNSNLQNTAKLKIILLAANYMFFVIWRLKFTLISKQLLLHVTATDQFNHMWGGTHMYIIKFLTHFFTETQTSKPTQNPCLISKTLTQIVS